MDTHLRITETEKMENNLSLSSELKKRDTVQNFV